MTIGIDLAVIAGAIVGFKIARDISQSITNFIFLGHFAMNRHKLIEELFNFDTKRLNRDRATYYLIDKDIKRESFRSVFRKIKNNRTLIRLYNQCSALLTAPIILAPILFFGSAFLSGLLLTGIGVLSVGFSHFLRRKVVCIDESKHLEMLNAIDACDEDQVRDLSYDERIRQNWHYHDFELIKRAVDKQLFKIFWDQIEFDKSFAILDKALQYTAQSQDNAQGLKQIVGLMMRNLRNIPRDHFYLALKASAALGSDSTVNTLFNVLQNDKALEEAIQAARNNKHDKVEKIIKERLLSLIYSRRLIKEFPHTTPSIKNLISSMDEERLQKGLDFFTDHITLDYVTDPVLVTYQSCGYTQHPRMFERSVLQGLFDETSRNKQSFVSLSNLAVFNQNAILSLQELSSKLRVQSGPRKGQFLGANEINCPYTRKTIQASDTRSGHVYLAMFLSKCSKKYKDHPEVQELAANRSMNNGKPLCTLFKKNSMHFFSSMRQGMELADSISMKVMEKAGIVKPYL